MNIAEPILKLFRKPSVPTVEVGDVVRVHQKIKEGGKERIQVFEGIVIATHEKDSLDATFTVRKIASGVGVEKTYLLHSPRITKIEFKRSSNVRRAKLYYLRDLTGKALKMKDRKVAKENWSELLVSPADEAQLEATEADVAEAVAHAEEQQAAEALTTEQNEETTVAEVAETPEVVEEPAAQVENSPETVEDVANEPEASAPEQAEEPVEQSAPADNDSEGSDKGS